MLPPVGHRQMGATAAGATLLRMLLFLTALAAAVLLVDLEIKSAGSASCCDSGEVLPAANSTDLDAAFRALIARRWLSVSDSAICVGPGAAPAAAAMRGLGLRAAAAGSAATAPAPCCGLPFPTASFDFAFSAALDRVRVPARVVLEMERVIRPGRFGAVHCRRPGPAGLMRVAAPVAALLRASEVVGALTVDGSAVVVFRKRGGGGGVVGPAPTAAGGGCDHGLTKVPKVFDEIIDQFRAAFFPELLKF
uniref:Putative methyltransferase PMT26 n=1 Tax=Anthurium amnicola TaxID=1678845 RepID=A0A1D1YS07_9ARAE